MLSIPFRACVPYQRMITQLGDHRVQITLNYNSLSERFSMDIEDLEQKQCLSGVPLVLGQDLLAPYAWNMGSLFVVSQDVSRCEANLNNLGVTCHLVWRDTVS